MGAVNRINYNQRNEQLNALAGARPCSSREDCVWGGGWRVGASVGVVRCFVIEPLREKQATTDRSRSCCGIATAFV